VFEVKDGTLYYGKRLALKRDLIFRESFLQSLDFLEEKDQFSCMVCVNNTLIYIIKYKEGCLKDKWHFAMQKLESRKIPYLYEQRALYLGE
jgi:hypothetical protein